MSERPLFVRKFNSVLHACTVGLAQKTTKAAYNVTTGVLFWCVSKLLDTSRLLERVTGVERSQPNEKPNRRKLKQNGSAVSGPETQLSRPLNQIIEDTFREEVARLTATSSVQNQKSKRKKSKKSGSKGETAIKTPNINSKGKEGDSNDYEITSKDKELSKSKDISKDKDSNKDKDQNSSNSGKALCNNKDSNKDNQDLSSVYKDLGKDNKAVSKDNKNSSQNLNLKSGNIKSTNLYKDNTKIIKDNKDSNKNNQNSSKDSSSLSKDSIKNSKTLSKDSSKDNLSKDSSKDNKTLSKDSKTLSKDSSKDNLSKDSSEDNKTLSKDSKSLSKDSSKDNLSKDSSKNNKTLNKDSKTLSKDSSKDNLSKDSSKDNKTLSQDSSKNNKTLNKDSNTLSKDSGKDNLSKDPIKDIKTLIQDSSKDNKTLSNDSRKDSKTVNKDLSKDNKAVSKDNKRSGKNSDSLKIVTAESSKEDLRFAKSTEVKSRDSKPDQPSNANDLSSKKVGIARSACEISKSATHSSKAKLDFQSTLDIKSDLCKNKVKSNKDDLNVIVNYNIKSDLNFLKPVGKSSENLRFNKPVDDSIRSDDLRFNKPSNVTVDLSKNNLESVSVNKKTNKEDLIKLSSVELVESTIKPKEFVLSPQANGNSKDDLIPNNSGSKNANLSFAEAKSSNIEVTSAIIADTKVTKSHKIATTKVSNKNVTSHKIATTNVKINDEKVTSNIIVTNDIKVSHIFTSNTSDVTTSQVDARTVQSSIQTKHKQIVDTLEEILHQSNELRDNILGETEANMKFAKIDADSQIRVLTLTHREHQDSTLYRLEKNWVLQFRLGPSLLGRKVYLFCNYPAEGEQFKRVKYNRLTWLQDEGCSNADDTALYAFINVKVAGSFHYYFTYDNLFDSEHQGSGFFIVDPVLTYGTDETLPLDCVQCQTVLAKSLGRFDSWERKLRVSKESGYNMIHFTPLQELGESKSSYCLKDQRKLNPSFNARKNVTFDDIEKLIAKLRDEWKVTSICDIVLNHTANESPWLLEHPEATYNCENCTYMRPAYLLDAALHQFSIDVRDGLYENQGIPTEISTEGHLNAIRYALHNSVLNKLKLQELYICDVTKLVGEFSLLARTKVPRLDNSNSDLKILQDPEFKRLKSSVNMEKALQTFNVYRNDCFDEESRIKRCVEDFKAKLDSLNQALIDKLNEDLNVAVENCISGIRYFRVQEDGPKLKKISHKHPLVYRNFTDYNRPETLEEHESTMYGMNSKYLMAHNGWVMDADPLHNFASDSKVYLRRELIAWGDSVKLRYGEKPEDSPFLWQHMRKYVEETARIFDGVRLDNCHSTPIPVAEYLLDCARSVRPDLYVVAELFTNSDQKDNIFVNRLGITSLIREAMSAWDSHEQGRLVYRYGGDPVGAFYQPSIRPLVPSVAHALFLDLTHDNPSPIEKRSVFDLLPSTALVNMACCASGSNRGYDELVPHHIHVVDESREYPEWNSKEPEDVCIVSMNTGIVKAKKALNDLHFYLGNNGFKQVYVDQVDTDIVAVTRHNPETHESVILVAFTAFKHPESNETNHQRYIKPLRVEGEVQEIIMEASLRHKIGSKYDTIDNFKQDLEFINGYSDYELEMRTHIALDKSQMVVKGNSGDCNVLQLNFEDFKPGSAIAFKVCVTKKVKESIKQLRALINNFTNRDNNELVDVINRLTFADLNRALYRCDPEERDDGLGFGAYDIPKSGPMVYCGLQGVMSLLVNVRPNNDLGHPLCVNLRNGNWLIEYISNRLKAHKGTVGLGAWIEDNMAELTKIPTYLIPAYFDVISTGIYILLIEQCYSLMSEFVSSGSTFVRSLALGSVQFGAVVKSSPLPKFSPNLAQPRPKIIEEKDGRKYPDCVSLSAGLPHFTTGFARNWGRDTFIALRGMFILTARQEDARYHILGYAACLRHGLIPNLLDGGNARYNCRDAVWWWLYSIKCYVEEVPGGEAILYDKVSRLYPKDDSPPQEAGSNEQLLHTVMQEALQVHFQGLTFRERNAGRTIDEHMSDRGFNVQIGVHPETGFTFGGNESNCGTWMDKMGSSDKANNRGKPATPRDGSSIEIVALSKSVLSWLAKLSEKQYPHVGVERKHRNGTLTKWSFSEWADKIHANFEKCFWINTKPVKGESRPDLINKRGIYKDCYGASQDYSDYQLRCNFPIAMVIAPELFNADHAWTALEMAEKHLLGPLGMKTLDSSDWNYCGDYDVSNDSNDPKLAHGFNYHQGPEWVWPMGYFLRARLLFAPKMGQLKQTIASTKEILSAHFVELQTSPWRGIPELTNTNGAYCEASSRTQAWSMSSILEVLHDLQRIESKEPININ